MARDTKDQIEREQRILEAYRDFRGALKQAEVLALEVLGTATQRLDATKADLEAANKEVEAYQGTDPAGKARLELARDEKMRAMQDEEKRYQIAKDLSDNLTIGYNTSEVIMARLMQTTNAKERVYAQAVSFFSTNDSVLTALNASFTGLQGLHESTETLNANEGRRVEIAGDAGRDRRRGAGSRTEGRLRPDRAGGGREEAGRFRRHLPGQLARDHQRDARHVDEELGGDPRRGGGRQAPPCKARRAGQHDRGLTLRQRHAAGPVRAVPATG